MFQESSARDTTVQNDPKVEMLEKEVSGAVVTRLDVRVSSGSRDSQVRMLRGLVGEKDLTSLHTLLRST